MKELRILGWRLQIMALVALMTAALAGSAAATDNSSGRHWHNKWVGYNLVPSSFPSSGFVPAIDRAAVKWTSPNTVFSFYRFSDYASPNWEDTNSHQIWYGAIPSSWGAPASALAATLVAGYPHMYDADMVFDSTEGWTDQCPWWIGAYNDVETVALHELGHFGGYLYHSTDTGATMYAYYQGCDQTLSQHDKDSINLNYLGH